jgi:hypothetical protein
MGALTTWFGWNVSTVSEELPDIFPISIKQDEFIKVDIINIYSKILTDVIERSHGLPDDKKALVWDNCVKSEASEGLLTLLSRAMADRADLFLVYESVVNVLRLATSTEAQIIKADYATKGESKVGVFISFKNYVRSDMIKLYSALEFTTVSALHKTMNLSKAVQFKMKNMRAGVSLTDSADVKAQAQLIAKSLAQGKDILLDGEDEVETSKPDLTAIKESISFLNQKRSFYLGLPESYINGELAGGLGDTGEGDTKAIERGLKGYFESIIKPVLFAVFNVKVTYKSQDFRQIAGSMEVIKTFSLVDDSLISMENKTKIVNQLLDLPEDSEGDEVPEPETGAQQVPDNTKQKTPPGK